MPPRHILIPLHDFNSGGTEVIAFRLAEQWIAAGWQVTVLAGAADGPMRSAVPQGVTIEVLDPPVPRSTFSRLGLGEAMVPAVKRIAPDVIFIAGNFHFILAHAFKRALPSTPIVAKISNPMLPDGALGTMLTASRLMPRYFRPIDRVVAMNMGLEAEHRRMAPASPVVTITDPNVPDRAPVLPMRDRREGTDPVRLLLIGRLEPQKDVSLALRVVGALRRRRQVHMTVLGEGYLRPKLESEVKRLGLEGAVALPGFIPEVTRALDAADLMLVTSRYEGGPAVAVEALARGLPVVSTDCSHFLRELLCDERLGRLTSSRDPEALADAVEAQLAMPPAPAELLERTVAPSRYGQAASAYLAVFEDLLSSKSA